ncbi:MAG TPA: alpha/beta fold hydrolase [Chitinophagaceae bacterium]|nr:alpha/beta fold hydrolase [Chitinophagaceae bacterium]
MAEELAKKGIATYRFDKKSLVNPKFYIEKSEYTVKEEFIDDAKEIVNFFNENRDEYPFSEIIILGHSLSSSYIPFLMNALDKKVSRGIMIGAASRSIAELMQEQIIYILENESNEQNISIYKDLLAETNNLLQILKSKQNIPNDSMFMQVPYLYWKDNFQFDFEKSFKSNNKNLLIIQGEKDYQVPIYEYETWKSWTRKHKKENVQLNIIPNMNHILFESKNAKSTPKEYLQNAEFSSEIISIIHDWVFKKS